MKRAPFVGGLVSVSGVVLAVALWLAPASSPAVEVNPCAAKTANPCAAKTLNPCAAKTLNPCAAKAGQGAGANPCAGKGAGANPCNPCGAKNPCNPCGGGSVDASRFQQPHGLKLAKGENLIGKGEQLWNDRSLGKTGLACASCHIEQYGQMQPTFARPYPHFVAMPHQQGGVSEVNAAEMVNFCMMVPMGSEPLDWKSQELAALATYVEHIQPGYKPVESAGANPCNPCGAKKNPCNPCATKRSNPCNPCGARR